MKISSFAICGIICDAFTTALSFVTGVLIRIRNNNLRCALFDVSTVASSRPEVTQQAVLANYGLSYVVPRAPVEQQVALVAVRFLAILVVAQPHL